MSAAVAAEACLLCGAEAPHLPDLSGLLQRCAACEFAWTTGDIAAPVDLYDAAYFAGSGYEDYYQPAARRFEAAVRLKWLLGTGPIGSLVEAGSAAGFFVEAARAAGIDARGVEVCEAAARYAQEQLGIPIATGCFEAATFDREVDAVCAFHVLEHVEDPRQFLQAARQALRPGGRLALEVPNYSSVAARRLGVDWPGLQPEFHRWHFTPASLEMAVRQAGFVVVMQDTAVFRYYQPPRFRRRQGRHQIPADLRNLRSLRLTHPRRGDLLRLVARRPATGALVDKEQNATTRRNS